MKRKKVRVLAAVKELLTYRRVLREEREKYNLLALEHEATKRAMERVTAMLELEKANTSYLYDCKDFLYLSICDLKNKCQQTERIKESFSRFHVYITKQMEAERQQIKKQLGYTSI